MIQRAGPDDYQHLLCSGGGRGDLLFRLGDRGGLGLPPRG